MMVAPRVGRLHLLDASEDALAVARDNLANIPNISFHLASVDNILSILLSRLVSCIMCPTQLRPFARLRQS